MEERISGPVWRQYEAIPGCCQPVSADGTDGCRAMLYSSGLWGSQTDTAHVEQVIRGTERISMAEFVKVAQTADVAPGEMIVVELDGHLICLANVGGRFYAVEDDCTHVGGPLDEGELRGEVLTCPWHLAQFNICTGKVLRGPARIDLPTYAVRVEGVDVLLARPA